MAVPKWYVNGMLGVMNGSLDLDVSSGYKLMLVTSGYTPDQAAHNFRDDLGANEASGGSGYPAGGFTIASLALTIASLTVNWDGADISQAIVGGPLAFKYGVFYRARGGAASADDLLGYADFGVQSVTDATLNITLTNPLSVTVS